MLAWLQSLPEPGLLAVMGLIGLGEGIVGIGFFLPGPPAMLIASATVGSVPEFLLLWIVVTVGAIVGNVIGFELGRRAGPALRETKLVKKHAAQRWDKAANMVHKHGSWAVFGGRLIAPVQSFLPPVAGAAGMSYRKFLPPLAVGAACSQVIPLLIGIGVVASLNSGGVIAIIVIALPAALAAALVVRKRRRKAKLTQYQDPELEPAG
ncbi:MAG TPA: DedA family protein [Dehalococcoidia bacterium]|nr:DedA family protein [Dehalococcoidia bacterium]